MIRRDGIAISEIKALNWKVLKIIISSVKSSKREILQKQKQKKLKKHFL